MQLIKRDVNRRFSMSFALMIFINQNGPVINGPAMTIES